MPGCILWAKRRLLWVRPPQLPITFQLRTQRPQRCEYLVWFLQRLEDLRPELSEREQVILFERLLQEEPRTLSNIAKQFSISRERIRQIETALLKRLKTIMLNEEG